MLAELAAVTVPSFLNAGLSVGIFDTSIVPGVSSLSIDRLALAGLGGYGRDLAREEHRSATAACARRADSRAIVVLRLARKIVLARKSPRRSSP